MKPDDAAREVARARRTYDSYEGEGTYDDAWAPFDEKEAAYRSRQALALATVMRAAGFGDLRGLQILDVGCGRGRQLRGFVDMGARPADLHGVDIHEPSVATARMLSPHLDFSTFEGSTIPFPDESFDLVTQHVVFSSIALPELREHLAIEMLRVCRTGGYIFWWDVLTLSRRTDPTGPSLDVGSLFGELHRSELRTGRQPTLRECARVPRKGGKIVQLALAPLRFLDYPATHVAALIGPKP